LSSSTFAALGAPDDVVARLNRRDIVHAFPIQAATVPDALAGRDLCGRAPTGSGKTIAFGIPLVARIAPAAPRRPRGLVLVPTRELAAQVGAELRLLAGPKGPSVLTVHGGVSFGPQVTKLRRGVDIVVACPGRLLDLVGQEHVVLDAVEMVVVDEADRMADMGFLPDVRRILDALPADRQTLLFSATLDGDVDVLVRKYQRNPVRREVAAEADAANHRHVFWKTSRAERVGVLTDVVSSHSPAIVFCRTKRGADRLTQQLGRAGVRAAAIHGDRSQAQRTRALAAFAAGTVHTLVATDVAARGIHIDDVALVVHFDPPTTDKDYVHRSGRTGRAGRAGVVVSFIDRDQQRDAAALARQLGLDATLQPIDMAALGALPRTEVAATSRRSAETAHPRRRRGRRR